jgi:hypothetical protein
MLTAAIAGVVDHPCIKHRSLRMTLTYARIANRTVADEYAAISQQVDALYGTAQLPAGAEGNQMARLRREVHARLLGNGLCTRPAQLDCRMESACETCTYFRTSIEFRPTLIRQRDHARDRNQTDRAALFDQLIQRVDQSPSSLSATRRGAATVGVQPDGRRRRPRTTSG